MTRIFSLTLAVLLLTASPRAQPPANQKLAGGYADIDRLFNDFIAERHVPGAAWQKIRTAQFGAAADSIAALATIEPWHQEWAMYETAAHLEHLLTVGRVLRLEGVVPRYRGPA